MFCMDLERTVQSLSGLSSGAFNRVMGANNVLTQKLPLRIMNVRAGGLSLKSACPQMADGTPNPGRGIGQAFLVIETLDSKPGSIYSFFQEKQWFRS